MKFNLENNLTTLKSSVIHWHIFERCHFMSVLLKELPMCFVIAQKRNFTVQAAAVSTTTVKNSRYAVYVSWSDRLFHSRLKLFSIALGIAMRFISFNHKPIDVELVVVDVEEFVFNCCIYRKTHTRGIAIRQGRMQTHTITQTHTHT